VSDPPKLKLFVVGELSGDPAEWSGSVPTLVIAENAEDALSRCHWLGAIATEVLFSESCVLCVSPDPRSAL
jgi:hypothetical protein